MVASPRRRLLAVRITLAVALVAGLAALWLATTDDVRVWPVRNTLQYRALQWWWTRGGAAGPPGLPGRPGPSGAPDGARVATGTLRGTVRDAQERPITGARVLVALWDGTTYDAASGPGGGYAIRGLPAGRYVPVAGAPGHADVALATPQPSWLPWLLREATQSGWWPWRGVAVAAGAETRVDFALPAAPRLVASPGRNLALGAPDTLACDRPIQSQATRRRLTFDSGGRPNQPTLLYTPAGDAASSAAEGRPAAQSEPAQPLLSQEPPPPQVAPSPAQAPPPPPAPGSQVPPSPQQTLVTPQRFPTLLTVYPGPADEWECASIPLAAAGYAVLAAGPAYSFSLEHDVDELARLLGFARAGLLPGTDGQRLAALGGSYSALHVLRLLRSDREVHDVRAAVLLGSPGDLFDMRRRFEQGTFIPPFGLDQALVALGFPDREPLRYWRYSGAYHVRPDLPPILLIHSRQDAVVPYQQSELFAAALAAAGVPHQLHLFEGASHYLLSEEGDARTIYRLTLEFLDRHLR